MMSDSPERDVRCRLAARLRAALLATSAALVALALTASARAEYVENQMGRTAAAITLATTGAAALAFDIGDTVYLARGTGDETGRIATGVGSLLAGVGLVIGGAIALGEVGEDHIPAGTGHGDSPEATALAQARLLGGIDVGLAAVSFGLGIAALATFEATSDAGSLAAPRCRLLPLVLAGEGAGLGLVGSF